MAVTPEQFFGLIAVKNGLLTREQLQTCFRIQQERLEETGIREPLSYIFYELGYLDFVQIRDVLQEFKYSCLRKDDKALAQVGLAKGYLTEEQIGRVLAKQREMFRTGVGTFQLGEILITNEILTPQQVFELYCDLWLARNPGRTLPEAALRALQDSEARTSTAAHVAVLSEPGSPLEPVRAAHREQEVMRDPRAGFKLCAICEYRNPAVAELCYGCGESLAGAKVIQATTLDKDDAADRHLHRAE